jgi:16S rRNA (adenine1518-N6/adenine1519-N6)-dimethyltransferase
VAAAGDLTDRALVAALLSRAGIRPSKRFGQNFLVDRRALGAIVEAVRIACPEVVLEIGAGLGTVTRELAALAPRVIAVEVDLRLTKLLEETLAGLENIELLRADILDVDFSTLAQGEPLHVVGNLPYRLTSPILARLVEARGAIREAVVLTQSEVAAKIAASPGPAGSALGVLLQAYARIEILAQVPRRAFHPVPEVDSTLWRIAFLPQSRFTAPPERFFAVVRVLYGKRRKMLRAVLRDLVPAERVPEILNAADIDPTRRGETLSLDALDRIAAQI